MKSYEKASNNVLITKNPVIIRVDGKAFHTFTRDCDKPFDKKLIEAMARAGERTAAQMGGFKLGYHQSDEFSFLLTDTDTFETQPWFNNEINKLVSITASLFTAFFNQELQAYEHPFPPAVFDARAFSVPMDDFQNYFVWRQQDWKRNSLQMLAQYYFSAKELHGKNSIAMDAMLAEKGVEWRNLNDVFKYGTFITKDKRRISTQLKYDQITELVNGSGEAKKDNYDTCATEVRHSAEEKFDPRKEKITKKSKNVTTKEIEEFFDFLLKL